MSSTEEQSKIHRSFEQLRQNYVVCHREMKHYRYLYRSECETTKLLQQELAKLTTECNENKLKVQELRRKLRNLNNLDLKLPVTRKRKAWCKITCDSTKQQRISQYGHFVQ